MHRDRIILLIGGACIAFGSYYVFMRLLAGNAIRSSPLLAVMEPSELQASMIELGKLNKSLAEDLKLLTADDCVMIELQGLAMAKVANDLKLKVPGEVTKASRADWIKMIDATVEASLNLAKSAEDAEKAQGPTVSKAYRELTESCVICHKAFGIGD